MFLIWEGVDKVGKDTLKAEIDKATKWAHVNLNRGPLGYMAYDAIHGRETDETVAQHMAEWDMLKDDCLVILMAADPSVLCKRIEQAGDEIIPAEELDRQQGIYMETIFKHVPERDLLFVDTSHFDLQACISMVLQKLRELQARTLLSKLRQTRRFESQCEDGTTCAFYEPVRLTLTPSFLKGFIAFDKYADRAYYEQLAWHCLQKIHMYHEGILNTRQVLVSQDDCVSLIQFDMAHYEMTGELLIWAHQRSWNVDGHGVNDLTFYRWLVKKAVKQGLLAKGTEDRFIVHWQCVYPHSFES